MADQEEKTPKRESASPVVSIGEFLKSVDADETLKHMFHHFYGRVNGIVEKTEKEFADLFEAFKNMPAKELK